MNNLLIDEAPVICRISMPAREKMPTQVGAFTALGGRGALYLLPACRRYGPSRPHQNSAICWPRFRCGAGSGAGSWYRLGLAFSAGDSMISLATAWLRLSLALHRPRTC